MALAALVVVAAAVAAAPPASAAEYVTGEWGSYQGLRTFWGNMSVGGTYGLCVDPGAEPPDSLDPARARKVCGTVAGGVADKTAQTAWLLARHLKDTDTQTLVSLSQFVRAGYHSGIPVTYPARFDELAAEAAQAGPKDAYVEVDLAAGRVWFGLVAQGQAAQITGGALGRGAAAHTPGFAATVAITTPNAKFADGSRAKTVTTAAGAGWLAFTATHDLIAGEKVSASVTVAGVPQTCFTLYEEGSYQRVATPLSVDLSGSHAATQDKTIWEPRLATEVAAALPDAAGRVVDKVKADAINGSQWPVKEWADADQTKPKTYFQFTAAGQIIRSASPQAASKTLPAGAEVLDGTAAAVVSGPGAWETASVALPAGAGSGWYSLRWCLDKADQGANAKHLPDGGPFCDDYFSATERFTVPMTLGVSTKTPASTVLKGEAADDTLTVFLPGAADEWMAGADGKPVTVKARGVLYGSSQPFAEQPNPPAGAAILGEAAVAVTLPVSGRDPVTAAAPAGFDMKGATHWSWVWEIRRADQTPAVAALLAADAKDSFGKKDESGHTPMTLAISTKLPDQRQAKNTAPDDTITVSLPDEADQWIARADGKPATVKAEGTFYAGSASSFTISREPPADAKILGAASADVTLPTSGREPVTVAAPAGFTVPASQYGTWVWRIDRADQAPEVAALFDNDPADLFGQALETHVTQMELTIQSEVRDQAVAEPKGDGTVQVCDRVWVEHTSPADLWLNQWGTGQPVEVAVGGKLHRSAVPGPQTTVIGGDAPVVGEWGLVFTAAGEDHAQTVCHTVAHGGYGAYGFAWGIDLDEQPEKTRDYLSKGATTPLWLPAETTIVKRTPVIHTTATSWTATNDGEQAVFFTDEVWQTDWPDGPEDTDLYGAVGHGQWAGYGPWQADGATIRVELWRIEGEVTAESCDSGNPAAKLIASNEATAALNTWGASQRVSGSRFKAEGGDATYTFVVTYPGDARTEPYQSVCGEESETITLVHEAPEFATELLTLADAEQSDGVGADREAAIVVEPGADLVDVLHAAFPDQARRRADMTGWAATWDVYFVASEAGGEPPAAVEDETGRWVYEGAVCAPETLLAASGEPVPVEGDGDHLSPVFTAPDRPGMVFAVETVTDGQGRTVRRGTCGLAPESALVAAPPVPAITTTAPTGAVVGEKVTDEAELTGPFPAGTVVEFWYQSTPFTDPLAAPEDLACEPPDPHDMEGATRIGAVTLDHAINADDVEKLHSPEFTVGEPGCTWIKEIAWAPGDGPEREVLAEGRFDAVNERTIWQPPPPAELPRTGAQVAGAAGLALVCVGLG
ncbi:MAG: hypothetical protein LBD77_03610, partial [Bifidobacteriaceae bacterium]|nr:hypothetical protein [Bifidobacteriaceae bacterium]